MSVNHSSIWNHQRATVTLLLRVTLVPFYPFQSNVNVLHYFAFTPQRESSLFSYPSDTILSWPTRDGHNSQTMPSSFFLFWAFFFPCCFTLHVCHSHINFFCLLISDLTRSSFMICKWQMTISSYYKSSSSCITSWRNTLYKFYKQAP